MADPTMDIVVTIHPYHLVKVFDDRWWGEISFRHAGEGFTLKSRNRPRINNPHSEASLLWVEESTPTTTDPTVIEARTVITYQIPLSEITDLTIR